MLWNSLGVFKNKEQLIGSIIIVPTVLLKKYSRRKLSISTFEMINTLLVANIQFQTSIDYRFDQYLLYKAYSWIYQSYY